MKKKPPRKPRDLLSTHGNYLEAVILENGQVLLGSSVDLLLDIEDNPNEVRRVARWLNQWADWAEYMRKRC